MSLAVVYRHKLSLDTHNVLGITHISWSGFWLFSDSGSHDDFVGPAIVSEFASHSDSLRLAVPAYEEYDDNNDSDRDENDRQTRSDYSDD